MGTASAPSCFMTISSSSAKERERRYILLGLRLTADFGAVIAVPVVALAVFGKWLDRRYGTWPCLTIAGFVVAAAISTVIIRRKARAYAAEYQALIDSEKKTP